MPDCITAKLSDWRIGDGQGVCDAPHLHWPVEIYTHPDDVAYPGQIGLRATRPDRSQVDIVLEIQDGRLAVRIYVEAANGEYAFDGEPAVSLQLHSDDRLEFVR